MISCVRTCSCVFFAVLKHPHLFIEWHSEWRGRCICWLLVSLPATKIRPKTETETGTVATTTRAVASVLAQSAIGKGGITQTVIALVPSIKHRYVLSQTYTHELLHPHTDTHTHARTHTRTSTQPLMCAAQTSCAALSAHGIQNTLLNIHITHCSIHMLMTIQCDVYWARWFADIALRPIRVPLACLPIYNIISVFHILLNRWRWQHIWGRGCPVGHHRGVFD